MMIASFRFGVLVCAATWAFVTAEDHFLLEPGKGIQDYLPSRIMEDSETLEQLREDLRGGKVVVIEDAFPEELAKAMYWDIYHTEHDYHEEYLSDGFHYSHHNAYDLSLFTDLMNATLAMFASDASKDFMAELTGRDCDGYTGATPSYYKPGDHSLPHTDHMGQRTVAFVWHLSRKWRPEWGGALYWCSEHNEHAYIHASFNTLTLFSVSEDSSHFVTTVSRHAKKKRLAFNGWYHSSWEPTADDPLEDLLATKTQRDKATYDQYLIIKDILADGELEPSRHKAVQKLMTDLESEWFIEPMQKRYA